MNRILYVLIGACVAGAVVAAFPKNVNVGRLSATDAAATITFLLAFAAGFLILLYTPWGRRLRSRFDKKEADLDKRVRETKGEVREPLGS